MAIDAGMNVGEVKALGNQLKTISDQIGQMVNALNTKVNSTSWVGADATKFKNDWWPGHRSHLQKIQQDLSGFGQSALNNASEQENISNR